MVDEEKQEKIRGLIRLQLACFSLELLAGIGQVITSVLLTVVCCRAWRWRMGPPLQSPHLTAAQVFPATALSTVVPQRSPGSSAAAVADGRVGVGAPSVLFSTRPTDGVQREGFISIPVPSGLYAVTGDTLDRYCNICCTY